MDEAGAAGWPSVVERLLQGVEDEVGVRRPACSPADDPPGVSVDDEGDIDEAGPGRNVGKIRKPQPIRRRSVELSVHMVERTGGRLVADRCPKRLAPDRPSKAHVPHQPGHRTARNGEAFPREFVFVFDLGSKTGLCLSPLIVRGLEASGAQYVEPDFFLFDIAKKGEFCFKAVQEREGVWLKTGGAFAELNEEVAKLIVGSARIPALPEATVVGAPPAGSGRLRPRRLSFDPRLRTHTVY